MVARDLRAELAAPEVIVLLFNAANMGEFDHGFSERAMQVFAAGKQDPKSP